MKANDFINDLCGLRFENTFNPYVDRCPVHDLPDAPAIRKNAISAMLEAACRSGVDSLWIGRDLGYRGGRRTGFALTDDVHFYAHAERWGLDIVRPTKGAPVGERTAAVIWSVLAQIDASIFLWNVFPLHPHESDDPFSNRSHNSRERKTGEELLSHLVLLLHPQQIVAIGNDATNTAHRLATRSKVVQVRHPSYGGQRQFLEQVNELYRLSAGTAA